MLHRVPVSPSLFGALSSGSSSLETTLFSSCRLAPHGCNNAINSQVDNAMSLGGHGAGAPMGKFGLAFEGLALGGD